METHKLKLGQVLRSIAGRDKGKFLIIIDIVNNDYVKICDGDTRKLDNPKLKKIKHLAKTNYVISELNEKLTKGQKISNANIRKHLEQYKKNSLYENGRFD